MKILFLGDSHFNDKRPERRLDADYFATMMDKLEQVVMIYRGTKCDIMVQVGDFFDSYRVCRDATSVITEYLRRKGLKIYCIWGQHDISGHSSLTFHNSPLRTLESAGVVVLLDGAGLFINSKNTYLYGASFGQKIPKPADADAYNVLVIHQMIGDEVLFPGQDIQHPRAFLRRHKEFDLIACGDYHYRFIEESKGRFCINPGAMVRKTISDRDLKHRPGVIIFDTKEKKWEVVELKFESAAAIFDTKRVLAKEGEDYETLLTFLENLKKSKGTTVGWREILLGLLDKEEADDAVRKTIDECILETEKAHD